MKGIPGLVVINGDSISLSPAAFVMKAPVADPVPAEARNPEESIQNIRRAFRYEWGHGIWSAENAGQSTRIRVSGNDGVTLSGTDGSFGMQLFAIGRDNQSVQIVPGVISADGGKLGIRRTEYTEWYLNNADGIEQGMTIPAHPAGTGRLHVSYNLSGDLTPSLAGQTLIFSGRDGPVFIYAGLSARDAAGRVLPARLHLAGSTLTWDIDDTRAVYPVTIDPTVTQVKALTASDGKKEDYFGYAVSVSGNTAVIGAPNADIGGLDRGEAYVFSKDYGGTDNWGQVKNLTASDGADNDCFGHSVAVDGSTAVIGAICAGTTHTGQAYVFSKDYGGTDNWGQVKILTASDKANGAYFGESVAINGNTTVVGAINADASGAYTSQGQAYVYYRDRGGAGQWGQVAILNASDRKTGASFGRSVAVSGTTVIVGANDATVDDKSKQGEAYIFYQDQGGAGNWGQVQVLTASDGEFEAGFGNSVAVDGSTAVIGAINGTVSGKTWQGKAYIRSRDQGGANNWGEVKILTASDGAAGEQFGHGVSVNGSRAVVGSPYASSDKSYNGKVYVFSKDQGGAGAWGQEQILQASDRQDDDKFGYSVAAETVNVVIGAAKANVSGQLEQGKAYVFATPTPTPPTPTPTPPPYGGSDDTGRKSVSPSLKAPLQRPLSTVLLNVGQIGRTPIVRVEITGVEVKDMIISAKEADGPGSGVPPPPGVVYEYVDISPARFTEITDAKIVFVVPLSWIDEHHLIPQEIVLFHHDGTTWEALPTTLTAIKDGEAYYTAEGSGFSRFAITGQLNATQSRQNVTPQRTVQTVGDLAQATVTGSPAIPASPAMLAPVVTGTTAIPAEKSSPALPFATIAIAGAAIVILACCIFLIRRWYIRRQNPALFEKYE
ncbi:PGF-pre-PGF domain-containing protein [uncultured Methanoregula sp.]|uniref:PGF-pre-PGF domain-containing protein n=1 Tax=uncultured Methanoregula sp. TaxID=1005933 RepID=UPI002AAC1BA6|nr:PGF-pre-PGF domain-containing protein [uncultured Methanoregula sp.]